MHGAVGKFQHEHPTSSTPHPVCPVCVPDIAVLIGDRVVAQTTAVPGLGNGGGSLMLIRLRFASRFRLVAFDRHLTAAERERIRARADLPPDRARIGQYLNGIAICLARVLQIAVNQVNGERVVAP